MDLHHAAKTGNLERVKLLLLEQGFDKEKADNRGNNTPLNLAACNGHIEVVRFLVEQGAHKETTDCYGMTPLNNAVRNGHLDVARYLLEQGANMEKTDNNGRTLLHSAAMYGYLDMARYLLEQGADRDRATDGGFTPLHLAALNGHLELAKLLMVYGADLNARNNDGHLPIDMEFQNTVEIKQAIRDEPRRRMDHGHKRATEQDRHPDAATSAPAQQQEEEEDEEDVQCTKRPRLEEGVAEEGKVAEEDEDSEPSSDEEDDDWICALFDYCNNHVSFLALILYLWESVFRVRYICNSTPSSWRLFSLSVSYRSLI